MVFGISTLLGLIGVVSAFVFNDRLKRPPVFDKRQRELPKIRVDCWVKF